MNIYDICCSGREYGHTGGEGAHGVPAVRLDADACLGRLPDTGQIKDIKSAGDYLCGRDTGVLTEHLRSLTGNNVVLEVSGGFSSLMSVTGSEYLFRMLGKSGQDVLSAVRQVNRYTAHIVRTAAGCGVKVISFADPSAVASVMGERRAAEFSAQPSRELSEELSGLEGVVMHLCPRTSFLLERYCAFTSRPVPPRHGTVLEELLNMNTRGGLVLTGHACIWSETGKGGALRTLYPAPGDLS